MNNNGEPPDDDRERFRVAVVVFVDVVGVDYSDAGSGATLAVRHALSPERGRLPVEHRVPRDHVDTLARVVAVMPMANAVGGMYLYMEPTRRAWRDYGNDFDSPPRPTGGRQ